ncbi:hypothetical protein LSH36_127g08020 [Paralvinella palmiformis]|uniref:RUN domain-containing protein n=1 Tax=Paralvinella palmiformis TaxID=53620 RepID=A0AAD9JYV2_9ANNE|nr:hypothetical protein LSH36_127g08020 [Paralvinella palmiformis]
MASTVSPKNSPNIGSTPKPSVTPDVVSVSTKVIPEEDDEGKWPKPVIADVKPEMPPTPRTATSDETPVKGKARSSRRQHGEWLCLRELTDVQLDMVTSLTSMTSEDGRDPMVIERTNLLNVCKLVIKELIDSSLSRGRMLDDDNVPLQQFFVVLEHVLRHGIKPKKGILRDKREFWAVLEQVEKYIADAVDITTSVREMPNIKTPLGRSRAWLRLALMQKRLADYFRILVDKKDELLTEFYEPGAIMLDEEAVVISGLLVGLNVIDCNLGIKDEDLDQPMGVIDFSLYLRDANHNSSQTPDEENQGSRIAAILDQKNYLEELNRHLNATVTNLQQKSEALQTANTLMKEDLAIAKNNILQLQQENSRLTNEKSVLEEQIQKHVQTAKEDLDTERETYNTSRAGLEQLYQETKQRLEEETHMRLDVEKELELQIGMKQEMEVALRLLEKDVHEKQDSVVTLRKQMDEIRIINSELFAKLQFRSLELVYRVLIHIIKDD